jgi:Uma2 family endonuclease
MGMPAHRTDWTVEMLNALPDDGNRYEVIDGELLVTPSPSYLHQDAAIRLYLLLRPYVERIGGLWLCLAPAAVTFSPRREVQPDLFALPLLHGRRPTRFADVGELVLAVEVISPSTIRTDRSKKRLLYQSERVPEYWVVDPEQECIERWRPGDQECDVLRESMTWQPLADQAALEVDVAAYFRAVLGG